MEGNNKSKNWKPTVGQCVIVLVSIPEVGLRKGEERYVNKVYQCKCGRYSADIGACLNGITLCHCAECGNPLSREYFIADTDILAPIERRTHEISIDKEIWDSLPKETQERSDVIVKPQEASVQNQLLDTIDEMISLLPQIPIDEQEAYAQKIDDMINRTCKLIRGESC